MYDWDSLDMTLSGAEEISEGTWVEFRSWLFSYCIGVAVVAAGILRMRYETELAREIWRERWKYVRQTPRRWKEDIGEGVAKQFP
jgi:hypothetical protein